MTPKQRKGCAVVILRLFIQLPIFLYLAYQILCRLPTTDLMWFLFWVYIPITVVSAILAALWGAEE